MQLRLGPISASAATRARVACVAVGLALMPAGGGALAQSGGLLPQGLIGDSPDARQLPPGSEAQLTVRIDQLEAQVRHLTGTVEQYSFQIQRLEEQLRRFQEDTEFRFRELGGGAAVAQGAGNQPRFQTPPAPPADTAPAPGGGYFGSAPGSGDSQYYGEQSDAGSQQLGAPPRSLGTLPTEPLNISPLGRAEGSQLPPQADRRSAATAALGVPADPQTSYDVAYAFILQGDFDAAEGAFADFLQRYPQDQLAGNAQYWLGESHYARGQYREAADAFLNGYTRYQKSPKAPDSLLKLGMSLKALGQKDAACASFAELGKKYPKASESVKSRLRAERKGAGC